MTKMELKQFADNLAERIAAQARRQFGGFRKVMGEDTDDDLRKRRTDGGTSAAPTSSAELRREAAPDEREARRRDVVEPANAVKGWDAEPVERVAAGVQLGLRLSRGLRQQPGDARRCSCPRLLPAERVVAGEDVAVPAAADLYAVDRVRVVVPQGQARRVRVADSAGRRHPQ